MSVNSLRSVLERMKRGSVTQGWGAVSVFNRGRLNKLLEQQYIHRFDGYSFLPSFNGRIEVGANNEYVELSNIALGQPLLSFITASLTDSRAVLKMNVIAGRYTGAHESPGTSKKLLSTSNISEAHGFTLEMDIDLSLVVGEVDLQGRVKLNLADGANFRCNLAGNDEAINTQLAEFFRQSFKELPLDRSVFQLGMLDLHGYSLLTPKSFRLLTQAAPGAKTKGALNYGDGGVVVLIRLEGNTADGNFPLNSSFPYLIPDDKEADGSDRYSATLVLSEAMIPYIENEQLDVLNNLLFPGDNMFAERERHTPCDLGVFGSISPKQTRISLDPALKTIKAGDKQQFTLRDWKGQVIQASRWRADSLQSHTAEGHGTIVNGLYTAASPALIGHESLHVVVTAEYKVADTTYTASALLLVVFDTMTVAPQIGAYAQKSLSQPIVLSASTLSAADVTWELLAPEYGSLSQNANQALFIPDARAKTKGLAVQQVEATGAEKRTAALLLLNAQQSLRVDPPYVPSVKKSTTVQLKEDSTLLPGIPRRWKVISGGGTVDSNGRFSAPTQGSESSSVVQCEIVRNGVVFSSGYSVIDLSELEPEPGWEAISSFTVKVPNGPDNKRLGSLLSNGYQQLYVEVEVQTAKVNDNWYPLSTMEKSKMRLVDNDFAQIPFIDEGGVGIPESEKETIKWATHRVWNGFDLGVPRSAASETEPRNNNGISNIKMYLHTREIGERPAEFHAIFQTDRDNSWPASTTINDHNSKIVITPLAAPDFIVSDYTFERVRVSGGGGSTPERPDDDFDFHYRTVDYWKLSYIGNMHRPGSLFVQLMFLSTDKALKNRTSIRWESEQLWETMFSWTGSIFQAPGKPNVKRIDFDQSIDEIVKTEALHVPVDQSSISAGQLVITLHRSDRVDYVRKGHSARVNLDKSLLVSLFDKKGNAHKLEIAFAPTHQTGNRNKLVLTPR